jgi:hypothetical protein
MIRGDDNQMSKILTKAWIAVVVRQRPARSERGDVPGWVLITLMTAGLVAALLAVARDELVRIFGDAMKLVQPEK